MPPLTFREKVSYGLGEIAGSGFWQIAVIFLSPFYTDTIGLSATAVGHMLLVARVFDALVDPLFGMAADRTRTRWGRFRPWLVWVIVPYCACAVAMFHFPAGLSEGAKLAYAYATYTAMMLIYSLLMIPYSALSGVMTSDAADRTSLNSFRFFFAFAASTLLKFSLKPAVAWFGGGDDARGFFITLSVFIGFAFAGMMAVFFGTRERVRPEPSAERPPFFRDMRDLLGNRPWVSLLCLSIVLWLFFGIRGSAQVYYFKYYLGNEKGISVFLGVGAFATLLGVVITPWLTKRIEKRVLLAVCLGLNALVLAGFHAVRPGDWVLLYSLQVFLTFTGGPFMPLLWSMMADTADYSEWRTGRRATGLIFSATTMAQKIGGALGGSAALYLLDHYGYVANQVQGAPFLAGIRLTMSVYLSFGYASAAAFLLLYPLTSAKLKSMQDELARRRAPVTS